MQGVWEVQWTESIRPKAVGAIRGFSWSLFFFSPSTNNQPLSRIICFFRDAVDCGGKSNVILKSCMSFSRDLMRCASTASALIARGAPPP